MKKIKFTSDFATKKAGDVWTCDSMLACHLVRVSKVAEFVAEEEVKKGNSNISKKGK